MEKRKIQLTGGSSFTVTLPKKWIIKNNLKDKDAVECTEKKSGALVFKPANDENREYENILSVDGLQGEEIVREIISCYTLAVDILKINGKLESSERNDIREGLNKLLGFEIIEENADTIKIKYVLQQTGFSFRDHVSQMFNNVLSMAKDTITAFETGDAGLARDVVVRDIHVDKFFFLILRNYNSMLQDKLSEEVMDVPMATANFYEHVAYQLERIADHAAKVAGYVASENLAIDKTILSFYLDKARLLAQLLAKSQEIALNIDIKKAHRIITEIENTITEIERYTNEQDKQKFPEILILSDSLTRSFYYLENIAEKAIGLSILSK